MSKITGKFQITLPKRLVEQYGIKVRDEVELTAAGEAISFVAARRIGPGTNPQQRAHHFDLATRRQLARERTRPLPPAGRRGWKREDLYIRGRTALTRTYWSIALDERGLDTLWSEDFEHGRLYGRVKAVDPIARFGAERKRPIDSPQAS